MTLKMFKNDIQGVPSPNELIPDIDYVGPFGMWTDQLDPKNISVRVFRAAAGRHPIVGYFEYDPWCLVVVWSQATASLPFSSRPYIFVTIGRDHPRLAEIVDALSDRGFERYGFVEHAKPEKSRLILWRTYSDNDLVMMSIPEREFLRTLGNPKWFSNGETFTVNITGRIE